MIPDIEKVGCNVVVAIAGRSLSESMGLGWQKFLSAFSVLNSMKKT